MRNAIISCASLATAQDTVPALDRKALIGRDHDPYNLASATGECGKGVHAHDARRVGSALSPARSLVACEVRTVERSVR